METSIPDEHISDEVVNSSPSLSRRGFLVGAVVTGVAVAVGTTPAQPIQGGAAVVEDGGDTEQAVAMASEALSPSEPVYSATGNSWATIPENTVNYVAGQMNPRTAEVFRAALSQFLSISERDAGNSAFDIQETLLAIGYSINSEFGEINLGGISRDGGDPVFEITDSKGNVIALCQTSHFGGITFCAKNGTSLNITVPSKYGPVPIIKNQQNMTVATLQLLKLARHGEGAVSSAYGFLTGR